MHIIVAYDIPDNRRRNRLARALEGFGVRVQKSIFEADMPDQRIEALYRAIQAEIDPEEDSIRIWRLCRRCQASVEVIGLGVYIHEAGDEIV
jgi:CRISPR-associated protein Cas2